MDFGKASGLVKEALDAGVRDALAALKLGLSVPAIPGDRADF